MSSVCDIIGPWSNEFKAHVSNLSLSCMPVILGRGQAEQYSIPRKPTFNKSVWFLHEGEWARSRRVGPQSRARQRYPIDRKFWGGGLHLALTGCLFVVRHAQTVHRHGAFIGIHGRLSFQCVPKATNDKEEDYITTLGVTPPQLGE